MLDGELQWSHDAVFDAKPRGASQARGFVTQHLIEHRLPYLIDAVRLVTSELVTNALLNAQTGFAVTLSASDTTVLLTVRDDSAAHPEQRAAQALSATGRGMAIVDIVSHEWGTNEDESGAKTIWASFAIRGPREF